MYTPVQFKVEEAAEAHALMRAQPFAILVTHGARWAWWPRTCRPC